MADQSIGNNLWSEEARAELLHILPQGTYHGQAEIRGSNAALRRLGEALIDASKKGQCQQVKVSMMASDGEGYHVAIQPMSDRQMEDGPLPYAQLGHFWDFIENDSQSAHRLANLPALMEAAEPIVQALTDLEDAFRTPADEIEDFDEITYAASEIRALRSALSKINGGGNG